MAVTQLHASLASHAAGARAHRKRQAQYEHYSKAAVRQANVQLPDCMFRHPAQPRRCPYAGHRVTDVGARLKILMLRHKLSVS